MRATRRWSSLTLSMAAKAVIVTMKIVEKTPNATFCEKPMPKARMKSGRKIDFGMEKTKKISGLQHLRRVRLSAIRMPRQSPAARR